MTFLTVGAMKFFLVFISLVLSFASQVQAKNSLELFEQGLASATTNPEHLALIRQQLGASFPLIPYLDYAQLHAQLPALEVEQIQHFRQQYPRTPLATQLYSQALTAYGQQKNWDALLTLAESRPNSLNLRCYYVQALAHRQAAETLQEVQALVTLGSALPSSCQTLLQHPQVQQALSEEQLISLMATAYQHNQASWLQTLISWLPDKHPLKKWVPILQAKPEQLHKLPNAQRYKQWYQLALARLASQDVEQALKHWRSNKSNKMLDSESKQKLGARIAWHSSISRAQPNRKWLDKWLNEHAESMAATLEQRARYAIREQDWQAILHWVALMPESMQQQGRWQYWQARAHYALGAFEEAHQHYLLAAQERSFYGFLAAERMQQPYPLKAEALSFPQLNLTAEQAQNLARVRLLLLTDRFQEAQQEWQYLLARVNADNRLALARYAELKNWHNFTIVAAIQTQQWNQLEWRFPLAWQHKFVQAAEALAPYSEYLMMAVARRESSFSPYAVSPAGARGLMQLMPNTARQLARQQNTSLQLHDLFDLDTNLQLGTRYLTELLAQYQGNPAFALAAYNAGPNRVKQWLNQDLVADDVWIETIPFKETREYVQAVLTYRVIFMLRAGIEQQHIALLDVPNRYRLAVNE